MRITRLPEKEFWERYNTAFKEVDVPTDDQKEALRERISNLQQAAVDRLEAKWEEGEDFEVGWDFNYCYHVCGGVYSERIISADYVDQVIAALNTDKEPKLWTYHTAVEADEVDGQFFVRDGEVFYPDDGPNFSELLR